MNQLSYLPTPTEQIDNYKFLQYSHLELYRLSQEVDQFYSNDHGCCLLKARLFIELWCHEVGEKLGLRPPVTGDLLDKIKQISASNKVPPYIVESLHHIRIEGNKSAHIAQSITGQWSCSSSLSRVKLKHLMVNLFELAQYLAFKLNKQTQPQESWQEPIPKEMADHVYAALNGNNEATYSLAERTLASIISLSQQKELNNKKRKQQMEMLKHDLCYWLDKAHQQGHPDTWLLFALVYKDNHLPLPKGQTIELCFKQALINDEQGEATYQFGVYLINHNQYNRGCNLIEQAGLKNHHKSIRFLQEKHYQKETKKYLHWLNIGVESSEIRSFTLDFEYKLLQWQLDVDNELLKKKARSAFISAQSRCSPGISYFEGYCIYFGCWGKKANAELGLKKMVESYKDIPQFIYYEEILFNLLKDQHEYIEIALVMSTNALRINQTVIGKAKIKFDLAMLIWRKLRENGKAKSPHGIKNLLRESAKEGCIEALQFIKSPKGRALLRDNSIVSVNRNHGHVDRKKLKKAKKSARKAKRK
ncbi:DUF4145 domain-containing protein [Colwellia sp. 12G3]|uniref:DUF4145 domain-containing protein n=1 Tax=Colwellia sp. 12G3 TaxID=2058299 RepID=UPI000C32685D|nr:DUF4145 domain-containing protein [Colwellia sp. 12G3]PKI12705.1 hypothetical protein CXF71_18390 [Colwellia sp. 12G3]